MIYTRTNPWFKKPRSIGEKVDRFRVFLKAGSVEKPRKKVTSEYPSKTKPLFVVKNG